MYTTSVGNAGGGSYGGGGSYNYGGHGGGHGSGAYGFGGHGVNAGGVHVAGPHGGSFSAGHIHGGAGHAVMGPGYTPGVHSGSGDCNVGSECCGPTVDPGFGVTPGVGGGSGGCNVGSECCGSTVHPGFGVAPGVGLGPGSGASCMGGPGVACGGAGSTCCEPAGAMVTNTGWSFVGGGNGDFAAAPSYNYVGQGAGAYVKEVSTTFYGWKLRPCCLALLCLLLLLPLLWLLLSGMGGKIESVDTPSITPVGPVGPVGICTVWGDPHVMTFDQTHSDYYSPGEYWLVKSEKISIQGRYLPTRMTNGLAVAKTVAIGGPLLKGHKIFISADSANVDGQPILVGFPSSYSIPNVADLQYNGQGTVMQKGRGGKALHIVHVKISDGTPEGIQLQINRWMEPGEGHYINVRITMHAQPGQDGHCGNFNGNPADDTRPMVRSRLGTTGVPPTQLLFRTKTAVVTANRPDINNCEPTTLENAKSSCKAKEHKFIPSMSCLIDVCFGGNGFAEENEDV